MNSVEIFTMASQYLMKNVKLPDWGRGKQLNRIGNPTNSDGAVIIVDLILFNKFLRVHQIEFKFKLNASLSS